MAILGVYDGHNAGAALIADDGTTVAAVEEERFSRIKNHDCRSADTSGPSRSVAWCLEAASEPITGIALGLEHPESLQRRAVNNFATSLLGGETQRLLRADELGMDVHDLLRLPHRTQCERVRKSLATIDALGLDTRDLPLVYVDHHTAHAAAFLLSPAHSALIVTLDGKGDDLSGSIRTGVGSTMQMLVEMPTEDSLGHLYSAATVACGFRPQRDEGKLTALAGSGCFHPRLADDLRSIVWLDPATSTPRSRLGAGIVQGPYPDRIPKFHNDAMANLIEGIDPADVARTVQDLLEEIVIGMVTHHLRETGQRVLVVAGGVFANVTLNRKLAELPEVDRLHIHPGMTDSGIALGSAAAAYAQIHDRRPHPLGDIGLGPRYSDDDATAAFLAEGYQTVAISRAAEEHLAVALARGEIVARFVGGCEYGPRALGNRSIFAPAGSSSMGAKLNQRLHRSSLMPFAPMVMAEDADELFTGMRPVVETARFMTTSAHATARGRELFPAAVHIDGTARPQLVNGRHTPRLAALLLAYKARTGVPAVINTSFNLHDEPMVCAPVDAARSAKAARITVVQVGDRICLLDGSTPSSIEP
jgi:carbamoyltransferase